MGKRRRRLRDNAQSRDNSFFRSPAPAPGGDSFFKSVSGGESPVVQRQEAEGAAAEEEKKDPIAEGLQQTGEKLAENESFKKWYGPKLERLKYTLWDKAGPADKAAMITFLGLNVGAAGLAFASDPQLRESLSGVNIGKPLGWIPYSPLEGFTYKLPGKGKKATEFSADFTLNPYLSLLQQRRPGFFLSGANFGLESSYDPDKGFSFTGGKFGLDFFGGALKAEGKTFNTLSAYPFLAPGGGAGDPPRWIMNQTPGMPDMKTPGAQFMLNADLLKLIPGMKKYF